MTIGKRLIMMLALAIVALLVVGGTGVGAFQRVKTEMLHMTNAILPSMQAMGDIGTAYRDMRTLLLSHIMEQDVDLKNAFNDKVKEARDRASAVVEGYSNLVTDDTDRSNYQTLKKAFETYLVAYDEALKNSSEGKADLAQAALYGKVMPTAQVLEAALKQSTAYNVRMVETTAASVDQVYSRSLGIFGGVILVAVIGLTLFGTLIFRAVKVPLAVMEKTVERIGKELDFTQRVPVQSRDEVGMTVAAFNRLLDTWQQSLRELSSQAAGVARQADMMASTSREMSGNSSAASEAASNMAATVEQVTVSINHVADRAGEADNESRQSGRIADEGAQVIDATVAEINTIANTVHDAAAQIDALARESSNISAVVNVIKEVADQTNLLALNAAIEAARAGEQGRGFAVVADEVRKLAERTSVSTQEIGKLIGSIQQSADAAVARMREVVDRVGSGVAKAEETGMAIQKIRQGSDRVVVVVGDISRAIREQSAASVNIAQLVERIAQMSEEASSAAANTSTAADELKTLSDRMQSVVERYRI
ncbi:methyl-accepting chemotaxis protein [Chitinimonas lacunae]|uniref:Methyl-accepting chemotaxis protein n=1 Tax=Chitinimonas lacunae TaxID=1963018 RepID=A0ABV8MR47_9NEIS